MDGQQAVESITSIATAYRLGVGAGIPALICAIGVVGRKVARGKGWTYEDFYVGAELTLAGVAGALVNLLDFLKPDRATLGLLEKKLLGGNIAIGFMGLFLYYLSLSFHQDYGPASGSSKKKQLFFLFGVSNAIGLLALYGAVLLMHP